MRSENLKQLATWLSACLLAVFVLAGCGDKAIPEKDIVDTAVAAGDFDTLVAAVKAAELVDTLKGEGPYTVFAPTDAAFAKLPEGTLDSLLKPENKAKLAGILTYHVVAGKVMAADVVKMTEAKTVNGKMLKISTMNGKVMVDAANVTKTDIKCSNGVIHVIDAVVLPQ
jgi:transforming growth factor-beta-induced protein